MVLREGTTDRRFPDSWGLLVVGGLSAAAYAWLALGLEIGNSWPLLHRFVLTMLALAAGYFIAWRLALRIPSTRTAAQIILFFAVVFRLALLPAGLGSTTPTALTNDLAGRTGGYEKFLLYDNDVWRFLWDGHVTTNGISPYRYSPAEIRDNESLESKLLDDDWWEVHDNISFENLVTIYPPVAQALFAVTTSLAPGSVFVFKILLVCLDLGTCWLLFRLLQHAGAAVGHLVLYAWSPLVVKEVAGSAHFESLTAFLLLLGTWFAVHRAPRRAVLATTAAALTKLAPIVALPLVLRRVGRRFVLLPVGLTVLVCLPFHASLARLVETTRIFAESWEFNSGPWALLRAGFALVTLEHAAALASWTSSAVLLLLLVLAYRRVASTDDAVSLYGALFVALAAVVVLSPAVMPWYLIWALPFAALLAACAESRTMRQLGVLWAALGCLSVLSYYFYAEERESAWWRWIEFGVVGLAALESARGQIRFPLRMGARDRTS
jgi:hypothetical protein